MSDCPGMGCVIPIEIVCPYCGEATEMWSDEASAPCTYCGEEISCVVEAACYQWCEFADKCRGINGN